MTTILHSEALPGTRGVSARSQFHDTAAPARWPWRAMAAALALEAILLGLTAGWLARSTSTPKPARADAPVMLSMAEPEPVAAPVPTVKPPEPIKAHPKPVTPVKHEPAPKPQASHAREPVSAEAPPIKTVAGADAPPAPSAVAVPEPAIPPVSASSGPDERFIAKLRAAVQAAVVYPTALQGMGLAANIDVEFGYQDGAVSNVHVTRPGRVATLDQAAIAAVQRAAMPPPPPNLAGALHTFKVRVIFSEN
ncbi:TonB family protein [Pandoraea pneumonica]|uniref:TonB family protein n=1 Tax=Pandoraea pneumonica TaxID=2508299 RepID=UPI003CE71570